MFVILQVTETSAPARRLLTPSGEATHVEISDIPPPGRQLRDRDSRPHHVRRLFAAHAGRRRAHRAVDRDHRRLRRHPARARRALPLRELWPLPPLSRRSLGLLLPGPLGVLRRAVGALVLLRRRIAL